MRHIFSITILSIFTTFCQTETDHDSQRLNISGIYPHLAYYNQEAECGTGAVVPWAGRLWVITYGPHLPQGSSDKLYEITEDLQQIIRRESIGGTPANRMIHRESKQLFIGPYAIDEQRNVRVISYDKMIGRLTGNARHLTDPSNKIYYATMEEGFYEVNINSLKVKTLYEDGHMYQEAGDMSNYGRLLPGAHGKGLYSGQGVLVYSNNGETSEEALSHFDIESGVLAEWNGCEWKVIRRNQFVEVTGPGGIYGNEHPASDPVWTTGWDHKSIILGVRDPAGWSFFRLPKASHSYDGAHGWNTEWPRIRDVGREDLPDYLMTMHGMFWKFPENFSNTRSYGIRPRSAYLKVIGDFARWKDQLVFGCDDSAQREFLNKRKVKGGIEGPGQSNSNLWFTSPELPDRLGPTTASGAIWLDEEVQAGIPSEPFLFAGWPRRSVWVKNHHEKSIEYGFEVDIKGEGNWTLLKKEWLGKGNSRYMEFTAEDAGEWIRVLPEQDGRLTVHFTYSDPETRSNVPDEIFIGLLEVGDKEKSQGLLYGLGDDRRVLGVSANYNGEEAGYYELNAEMDLVRKDDDKMKMFIDEKFSIPSDVIVVEPSSVLVVDDQERRWRLPRGDKNYDFLIGAAQLRISREVATERDLFNCHGTFYELPAENADGFAKIRPVASHNFRIHDYASYRGMLIMTGLDPGKGKDNPHIFISDDGKAAVWAGVIDDLWKLGKPRGAGGPWKDTKVEKDIPSDPYLIGFYDHKSLELTHDLEEDVFFEIEVDPVGHGPWMEYMEVSVASNERFEYIFPDNFQARWIRFKTNKDCRATAWLIYE
jgi:hypothetical protein